MKGRTLSCVMAVALLLAGLGVPAFAQASGGRIVGAVRDAGGAAVQRATITATSTATGAVRRMTTGADGRYAIANLASGTYTVTATMVGYRRESRSDVRVAGTTTVDFTLQVLPLQAVTVTATLREQSLADIPFSVAAPSARALRERGVDNLESIAINVAGFSVQNLGPGQNQVALRGASSGQIARDQPGVKEQVGAYLDDVPISLSLFTPDLDLFDVSRVEVLRGPQGTLFGSGSLSGTVRYISGQPELGVRSTFGEIGSNAIGGGSMGSSVKLGVNAPLTDKLAARIVGYYNQMGGFMDAVQPNLSTKSDVNDGSKAGVRASVKFAPNDRFSITPRIVAQRVKTNGWNRIDAFNILANPYTTTRPKVTLGEREQFTQIGEPFTDDFFLGDVNMRWDFGATNLTSISSASTRDVLVVRDAGALTSSITGGSVGLPERVYTLDAPLDDATNVKTFTQELRLAGSSNRTRWVAGAFYSNNRRDYGQSLMVRGFQALSGIPTKGLAAQTDELFYSDLGYDLSQIAVFGEGTMTVREGLDLTAGLRWYKFDETRSQIFDGLFGNDDNGKKLVSVPGSTNANGFAPRLMASYKASATTTFNAQVSRGFRLGGINDPLNKPLCTAQDLATFSGRDSWKDETAWNYEVGAKSEMAGGKATLNASAFNMDISDLQLIVTAGSCSSRLVFNVPKARTQGVEIEFNARPNEHWDFSVSSSMNNSALRSTLTSTPSTGAVSVVSGIKKGNRLPSVPQVQGSAAASYRWRLQSGWNASMTGTVNHVGSRYTQIDDLAAGFGAVDLNSFGKNTIGGPLTQSTFRFDPELPAYQLLNLRFGLNRGRWEASFFANNITDELALLALDRERGTRARVGYLTNQPRTIGANLRFEY